ncbi:MAG: STY0301 family protein [Betaproteobacteria bacterium]
MTTTSSLPLHLVFATLVAGAPALAATPAAVHPPEPVARQSPPAPVGRVELPPRPASATAAVAPPASAAAPAAPAGPLVDACPAQLPVRQTIAQDIAGWTAQNQDASYPFARVTFFPGPPAQTALIVPTLEYKGPAGLHDAWELPRNAAGYWVACGYGNTTASIARKLPDNVDYCQADYDGRFMTLVVKRWSCGEKRLLAPPPRPAPARSFAKPPPKPTVKPPYKRGE